MQEFIVSAAAWAREAMPHVTSLVSAIVVLGVLVFAHELGHFILAKMSGVGVLKFSLGFGRRLFGFKRGETEYLISAFPLGGYVKMIGEDGEEELSEADKKRSFAEQSLGKRAMIVFAGPLFNIVLAVVLCYGLFLTGYPTAIAKVVEVVPGSAAETAGFMPGDIVEEVNGSGIDIWDEAAFIIDQSPGTELDFHVRRDGRKLEIKATPEKVDGRGSLGLMGSVVVSAVRDPSPAYESGIRAKDRIVAVDGVRVGTWTEMAENVRDNPGKTLVFTIERDGKLNDVPVTPTLNEDVPEGEKPYGLIGVHRGAETENIAYGPVESAELSLKQTYLFTRLIVTFLRDIIKGEEDASQMGGPVAIVQISGRQARQGWTDYIIFMALLSVNLGIINLFPIPILDGGHLFFIGIEAVMGRPLSLKKRELAQQVGLFLLISLMVFVFYNDIARLLGFNEMWR